MFRAIGRKYQETALIKLIAVGLVAGILLAVAAPEMVPAAGRALEPWPGGAGSWVGSGPRFGGPSRGPPGPP